VNTVIAFIYIKLVVIHIMHFSFLNNQIASAPSSKGEYFYTIMKFRYISIRRIHIDIQHIYNHIDFSLLIHVHAGNTGG
jgi:hypothetical protein